MPKQPKPKKVGRPTLPKGEAKRRVIGLRLTEDDIKRLSAAAKAKQQSVSEFVRGMLKPILEA